MADLQEKGATFDIRTEIVHTKHLSDWPEDYHCDCGFCQDKLGLLIRPDGTRYKRTDRRQYYDKQADRQHFAKTPLHVARWAIQRYTKPGDWVLDPTIGAGTTAVEALNHDRNAVGCEIQFIEETEKNIALNNPHNRRWKVWHDDARNIGVHLAEISQYFDLIVNNPPYSGDKQTQRGYQDRTPSYDVSYNNLAFLNEGKEYWIQLAQIYKDCVAYLRTGGRFVISVKDMVRNKKPMLLHKQICEMMGARLKCLEFVGVALLPHYPTTQFMHTYPKRFPDVKIPRYQTICVWQKVHD